MAKKRSQSTIKEGWRCPVCGQVNAPHVPFCPNCRGQVIPRPHPNPCPDPYREPYPGPDVWPYRRRWWQEGPYCG